MCEVQRLTNVLLVFVDVLDMQRPTDSLYLSIHGQGFLPLLITHFQSDVSPNGRVKADELIRQKYDTLLAICLAVFTVAMLPLAPI